MAYYRNVLFRFIQSVFLIALLCKVAAQPPQWNWARTINAGFQERINDVVADKATNDVYIVGEWESNLSAIFPGGANPSSDFTNPYGARDGFLAKYDSSGNFIWAFKVGGPANDIAKSIAIDANGNIYITGYFGIGTSYFSGTSPHTAPSTLDNSAGQDFYIAKYNSSGEFQWVKRSETDFGDLAGLDLYATTTAVYATGRANVWATFGALSMSNTPNQDDIFLIKYNLDGTEQWVAECGSNDNDLAFGVIADDTKVYFTGSFKGSTLNLRNAPGGTVNTLSNANSGTEDIVIACYNADGTHNWSTSISSPDKDDAYDITMDADSIYITGDINNNATFPGYTGNPVFTSFHRDAFLSSHGKASGNTGWVEVLLSTHEGPKAQRGRAIDMDGNGILYVTGDFDDDLFFPDFVSLSSAGGDDVFLASYSSSGSFRWALSAGSTGKENGLGISAGSGGTIYIGGLYSDLMTLGPLTLPNDEQDNGYLAKLAESLPPDNDHPCSAILLPVADTCNTTSYDNNGATDSGIPDPGCADFAGGDVWFKAVIPPSGNLFIGTNTSTDETYPPTNGWMYRIGLAVYSGSCTSLNLEGCYSYNSAYHYRTSSAFLFDKNPGDTVWIRIWEGFGNEFGNFSVCTYDPGHYPAWDIPESQCAEDGLIYLDTTITGLVVGFVDQVAGFSGIPDPGDAIGVPDLASARLFDDGDWIKLDLTDTIPPGETYQIYFRSYNSLPGVTQMTLWESVDDVTYYPHSFKPETEWDNVTSHFITVEHPTRYLLIENDNAGGGGFAVDGIKYYFRGTRGGTWSGPGVTGSLFDPTGLSGPIPITYSVGGSTTLTDSTRMINIGNSEGGILTPDTAVCFGNDEITLKLNDFRGNILSWESSVDGFSTTTSIPITDPFLTVSNLTETTRYRVTVQDGSCEPDTSNSITVTVHPPSTAHLSGDTIICNGSAAPLKVDFTGASPWSLEYENDIDTILITGILTNPYVFNVSPSLITSYSIVSLVDGNGCSGQVSGSATVEPIPRANPGKDSAVCGLTFQLEAMPSTGTGIWSQSAGPGNSIFTPGIGFTDAEVTVDTYGSYEFTWTETDGACIDDSNVKIDFYEAPSADAGSASTLCGLTAGMQANPSVGAGTWSVLNGPGTAVFAPDENDPFASVTVSTEGSFQVLWTEVNGPCIDSDTITLIFFSQPVADAGTGGEECDLDFQLLAIPSTGTGLWTKTSGPGNTSFSPAADDPQAIVMVDQYGSYRFAWTETNGPCMDSAGIAVAFNEQTNATATAGGDICGLSFQLEAFPSVGTGVWSKISGPGNANFVSGVNSAITTVIVDEYGSYDFGWTETNGTCSDNTIVRVNFFGNIIVDAGMDSDVCGLEYNLTATPATWSGYWEKISGPGSVTFGPSDTSNHATVTVDAYGSYEFQWFEALGDCSGRDQVVVSFYEQPVADAGPDQVLDHVFSTFLEANIPAIGTGSWELVKGTGQIQAQDDPGSRVTDLSLGENEFKWTINSPACADVSDHVLITVKDIQPPTVITPNNDGYNDHLVFSGISELGDSEIIIFSRWGNELYRNENYQNDWDGRDQNGRELPLDTYYYILKLSSGRLIKGYVEIRR